MIFALILLVVVLIAFATIGPYALLVIPLTGVVLTGLFAFIAMLAGAEGAGEIFLWCAGITIAVFAVVHLATGGGQR